MSVKDKANIAKKYNIPDWQIMESWLRSLNYVRNVVAHHSCLWNRNLIDQPKLAKLGTMPAFDSFSGIGFSEVQNMFIFTNSINLLCHSLKNNSSPTVLEVPK